MPFYNNTALPALQHPISKQYVAELAKLFSTQLPAFEKENPLGRQKTCATKGDCLRERNLLISIRPVIPDSNFFYQINI
jgi:hypothetical protein